MGEYRLAPRFKGYSVAGHDWDAMNPDQKIAKLQSAFSISLPDMYEDDIFGKGKPLSVSFTGNQQ